MMDEATLLALKGVLFAVRAIKRKNSLDEKGQEQLIAIEATLDNMVGTVEDRILTKLSKVS